MKKQMSPELAVERVRKVLSGFLKIKIDEVQLDSHLINDLGIDSVDFWEVIAKMEKEFEIKVPQGEVPPVVFVRDIVQLVKERSSR